MREQLDALLRAARPTVTLQVLPFEAREHGLMGGSLTLLPLPDGPETAYLEGSADGKLVESPAQVTRHAMAYSHVQVRALSPEASAVLVNEAMESYS